MDPPRKLRSSMADAPPKKRSERARKDAEIQPMQEDLPGVVEAHMAELESRILDYERRYDFTETMRRMNSEDAFHQAVADLEVAVRPEIARSIPNETDAIIRRIALLVATAATMQSFIDSYPHYFGDEKG